DPKQARHWRPGDDRKLHIASRPTAYAALPPQEGCRLEWGISCTANGHKNRARVSAKMSERMDTHRGNGQERSGSQERDEIRAVGVVLQHLVRGKPHPQIVDRTGCSSHHAVLSDDRSLSNHMRTALPRGPNQ